MKLSIDPRQESQSVTADWRPVSITAIEGVVAREVKHVLTNNGAVLELLRTEWLGDASAVDQVVLRTIDAGGISAWHVHRCTTDRLFCVSGRALVVLYDARLSSRTHSRLNEYRLGPQRPTLLIVPPGVVHGVKALGTEPAMIVNMVNEAYSHADPDDWRLPQDAAEIPYRFV
jgi:dTDP-4-dehydrorhamnose 3,5-epimerase